MNLEDTISYIIKKKQEYLNWNFDDIMRRIRIY